MGGGRKNKNVVFFSGYVCRRTFPFRDDVRHIPGGPQFVTRPVYRRTMKHMRTCTTLHTSDPSFAAIFMCILDLCSQGLPLTRYLYVRCVFFLFFSFSLFSFFLFYMCILFSFFLIVWMRKSSLSGLCLRSLLSLQGCRLPFDLHVRLLHLQMSLHVT